MICDLPYGITFYVQRSSSERLEGVRYVGNELFDVPNHGYGCREGINVHHLMNFYDKYYSAWRVSNSDKYPMDILFFSGGFYADQPIWKVLGRAQEPQLLDIMNVEERLEQLPNGFETYVEVRQANGTVVRHTQILRQTTDGTRFCMPGHAGLKACDLVRVLVPGSKNSLEVLRAASGPYKDHTLYEILVDNPQRRPVALDTAAIMARHAAAAAEAKEADEAEEAEETEEAEEAKEAEETEPIPPEVVAITAYLRRLPSGILLYAQSKGHPRHDGIVLSHDDDQTCIVYHGQTRSLWDWSKHYKEITPSWDGAIGDILFVAEGEWKDKSLAEVLDLLATASAKTKIESKHAALHAELEELQALEARLVALRELKESVASKRATLFAASELATGEVGLFAATAAAQAEMQTLIKIEQEVIALRTLNESLAKAREILMAPECV